jgi:hypothetical protein
MNIDILNLLLDEVDRAMSPQLSDAAAPASAPRPSFAPSEVALIVALAAELEATEARARHAESLMAAHGRHCICRAAEIAAEEAMECGSASVAEVVGVPVSGLTTDMSEEFPSSLAA